LAASGSRRQLTVCPVHRLRYDPSLTSGCVLCRRERPAPAPRSSSRAWLTIPAAVLLGLAGLLLWQGPGRPERPPTTPPASRATAGSSPGTPQRQGSGMSAHRPRGRTAPPSTVSAAADLFPLPPSSACRLLDGPLAEEPPRWPVSVRWHEGAAGYVEAQREQDRCKAPMVIYFRTDWCPYCREFEEDLLGDYRVDRYLRNELVKVRINPEDGSGEESVADEFENTGYPSVYVVPTRNVRSRKLSLGRRDQSDEFEFGTPTGFIEKTEKQSANAVKGLVREGYDKRNEGDVEGSLAVLTEALGLDPKNAEAYFQRGLSHLAAGAPEQAYAEFRAALLHGSDSEGVFNAVGKNLGERRLYDQGVACWTAYLERAEEGDAWGHIWRSQMHYRRGDRVRARKDAEAACRLGESKGCELSAQLGALG